MYWPRKHEWKHNKTANKLNTALRLVVGFKLITQDYLACGYQEMKRGEALTSNERGKQIFENKLIKN